MLENNEICLDLFFNTQVTYTAIQNTDLFCWDYGVESVLSYLPLSHVAGQMMDVFLIMSKVVVMMMRTMIMMMMLTIMRIMVWSFPICFSLDGRLLDYVQGGQSYQFN